MMTISTTTIKLGAAAFALWAVAATAAAASAAPDASTISGMGVRNIGSAQMSGRISAIAGRHEKDGKVTLFIGAASGGVWKSTDGGTTYRPVFDKEPVQSIGAITIDPSHPDTIWVGTGESWTRNSVSIGDGIYKSTDGGENWTNMGLPNSERITRIVVDPKNSDIVYACVPGKLWSDSADRGLYRTTDGGAHWSLVLKGTNLSTGCSSVAMDPSNPNVLLAGMWDFRRKGWTFRSGGDGPTAPSGSAMYRSTDGGTTWAKMSSTTNFGLPKGPWGRVEIEYAPSDAKIVYAFIESTRSALFYSKDGGESWEERDRSQRMVWRPFYFSRLVVDPNNPQRVFKMNLDLIVSDDGGKSFTDLQGNTHGDWHDVWIDPTNSKYIVGGNDGGEFISYDGGNKWWKGANLPISQFYHVSVDNKDPYQVYGGLQDNSDWVGDSAYPGGITNSRWENLNGGDGFFVFPDPSDPNFAYSESQGGSITRTNRATLESKDIQPRARAGETLRYNWNTPVALSPTDPSTIYIGAQFLFRSHDHGNTWDRISPDLTTNDPEKQQQEKSGGITVDNSAAETYTTIYSISESPKDANVIWVGTDDGNVQVTQNGGGSWHNVGTALPGLPTGTWVSWVQASPYDAGTAFVTVDRHMWGDMTPYVYRTTDYGKTWTPLTSATSGINGYAWVIKQDPVSPNLLYLGTEFGLYISLDGGSTWAPFKPSNFPAVAVRDIAIQPRDGDLVLATHGRGIWIVDDLAPLRAISAQTMAADVALLPGRPVQQRISANGGWSEGDASYFGDNPATGAVISYSLKSRQVIGKLTIEILDAAGNVVDTLPASKRKGLNRVTWSMNTKPPLVPPAALIAGQAVVGPRVLPGNYTVRVTRAGTVYTMPLVVGLDRRVTFTVADRKAQFDAANRVKAIFARMYTLVAGIASVRGEAAAYETRLAPGDPLRAQLDALSAKADTLRKLVVATTEGGAITGELRLRENTADVYGAILSTEGAPPPYILARVDALDGQLADVEKQFATLTSTALPQINPQLKAKSLPPITVMSGVALEPDTHGGRLATLARNLVGVRYMGDLRDLSETATDDK
jgi:photosystem II stability/assembly factor-like uncharacterized protein